MTRPPLEVDLVRTADTAFIDVAGGGSVGHILRSCLPSFAVAPPHSAVTSMRARAAGIALPSRITVVAIVIARSVRPVLVNAGSRHVAANFCLRPTSMWFSLCLRNWLRWLCRTRKPSMVCCFAPAQKLYSKRLVTPGILAPRSASSACCTPGTRSSNFIPMSTASSQRVGSPSIAHVGFGLALDSSSPSKCSGACFAASSSLGSSRPFSEGSYTFRAI